MAESGHSIFQDCQSLAAASLRLDPLRNDPVFLEIERQIIDDVNRARSEVQALKVASL